MHNRYYQALLFTGIFLLFIVIFQSWKNTKQEIQTPFYSSYISNRPISEIKTISLTYADNQTIVTVKKDEGGRWRITTLDDFPASQKAIARFLHELTNLTLWQVKTAQSERYQVLGVESVDNADAQGIQVSLSGFSNHDKHEPWQQNFIVGLPVTLNQSGGGTQTPEQQQTWVNGFYMRITEQSYSVLGALTLPVSENDWLDTSLLSELSSQVERLSVTQHNQSFTINREYPPTTLAIENNANQQIPASEFQLINVNGQHDELPKLRYKTVFSGLVDSVSRLGYISVKRQADSYLELKKKYLPHCTEIKFKDAQQQLISLLIFTANNRYWLKVQRDNQIDETNQEKPSALISATEISALIDGYVFEISPYYYRLLTRPLSDYTL